MDNTNEIINRLEDVYFDSNQCILVFDLENEIKPAIENTSFYAVEEDGCLYHYCGKTRIKIHEHFPDHGKSVSELIENVILHTAKKTA